MLQPLLLIATLLLGPSANAEPHSAALAEARDLVQGVEVPDHAVLWESVDRIAGTTGGQAHLDASFERFEDHRRVVLRTLRAHGLPEALAAIPVIESGYQNLDSSHNPVGAAGLWQFIPDTARAYGMRVTPDIDDRLDVRRETEAAASLLADLHDRYDDWGLALSAYNQGPSRVDRAIATHGTTDVFALIDAGALSRYPADVMAVMVCMADSGL